MLVGCTGGRPLAQQLTQHRVRFHRVRIDEGTGVVRGRAGEGVHAEVLVRPEDEEVRSPLRRHVVQHEFDAVLAGGGVGHSCECVHVLVQAQVKELRGSEGGGSHNVTNIGMWQHAGRGREETGAGAKATT